MASSQNTVDFLLEQMESAGGVRARKMFGEYGVYCGIKFVGLICNDQLFVKPTIAGREFIGTVDEAPPYPGAKNYFLVSGEKWDDRDWMGELIIVTAQELPEVTKKKKRENT
jgi:TfoX/Sxy family transcriptional regulator of competence genes